MRYPWLLLLATLACFGQAGEVYQYVDEHGNRVFTDKPPLHVDAEEVKLPAINSTPMSAPAPSSPEDSKPAVEAAPYQQLAIIRLPDDEAIRANNGDVLFQVQIRPNLGSGHRLQLLVDGQPHGPAIRSIRLPAHNLDRGEHSIAVQVVANGKVIQQSSNYSVNIQRTHVNAPARRAP